MMIVVIGSETIAIGNECLVFISIIIQSIDPKQKDPYPINKYKKVPLDLSNLLKQEIKSPGNSILVNGIHAHLR